MPLNFVIVQPPLNGVLTRVGTTDRWAYAPNTGFTGVDTFTYKAVDGGRESNTSTVKVTVLNHPLMEWVLFEPGDQVTTGDHLLFCPTSTKRLLEVKAIVSAIVNGAPGTYGQDAESRIKVEIFAVNDAEEETLMMVQPRQIMGGVLAYTLDLSTSTVGLGKCVHLRVTQKVGDVRGLKVSLRAQQL